MRPLEEIERRRVFRCRLLPDRALRTFDEAAAFLTERGLLTRTADCRLPSLFESCHEEPYSEGGRGFASWPRTAWWWASELEQMPDVTVLKVHRGKNLMLTGDVLRLVDPICRAELERLTPTRPSSAREKDTRRLLDHLADAGPSTLASLEEELGLHSRELRAIRYPLERCGALVSRSVVERTQGRRCRTGPAGHLRHDEPDGPEAPDGAHVHTSELARYDQVVLEPLSEKDTTGAMEDAVVAGVDAAVVAEERDVCRWFSWTWYLDAGLVDRLVAARRILRPAPGMVATTT